MKKIVIFFSVLLLACGAASCQKADSERPWGSAVIYMPQAGYTPYAVPNGGTAQQSNKNYRIDAQAGKVHIFLGIYRAGLAELQAYTVSVSVGSTPLDGTVLLPGRAYTLPSSVSCPDGKRDATFFPHGRHRLSEGECRQGKHFSLPVTISDPTRYALNDKLTTTQVRIDTSELLSKEGL